MQNYGGRVVGPAVDLQHAGYSGHRYHDCRSAGFQTCYRVKKLHSFYYVICDQTDGLEYV